MKKVVFTLICLATLLCGCRTVYKDREVVEYVPVEPVTYYYFQGVQYGVHSLISRYEDGYHYFLIAREPEAPYMSRIELIVPDYNLGKILDFSDAILTKGIDYVLLYEDARYYYSPDYAPKSGTLQVRKNSGENSYKVKLNAILKDGSALDFEYNGKF